VILLLQRFDTVEQAIRRQISSLSPMSDNNLWGMLNELRPYWFKEGRWVFATDSTWQKSIFYRSDDLKNKLVARVSTKDTMSDSINLLAVHLTIGKAGQYGEYSWESTQGIHKKNIENLQEIAEFLRGQIEEKMKKEK